MSITALPNGVQCDAVFCTISPVTQTADVLVKKASKTTFGESSLKDIGNERSIVPININVKNPSAKVFGGLLSNFFILNFILTPYI